MEHPKASPSRLAAILLFVPAAVGAAYPAVFGGVILVRGLAAGSEDVLFAEDSGAPGWLFAVLGLALLACVAVVLHIAWLVAFDRAGLEFLVVSLVLCVPFLVYWVAGLVIDPLYGLLSLVDVAPYLFALVVWRLAGRIRHRHAAEPGVGRTSP